jgi:hypothetical protein
VPKGSEQSREQEPKEVVGRKITDGGQRWAGMTLQEVAAIQRGEDIQCNEGDADGWGVKPGVLWRDDI